MSGIMPGAFITFDGESIPGRVPPRLIVRDNPMSKDQHNAVKHVYQEFARHNGLSLAGYHVNEARLPDGTRVRMESNNGVDRVTVWPGRSSYESLFDIRPLALFVSLDAPFGVWPGPPVYAPSAVSETPTASLWSNPPLEREKDLEFSHGYRSTVDSQSPVHSFPGTMDWYDDRGIESPNFGLVITWWPKYPHRYGSEIAKAMKFSDPGLNNRKSIGLADVEFRHFATLERYVWCNGILIAVLPFNRAVEGACLHTRNDGSTVLRVIASQSNYYYVYEGLYQRGNPPGASQTGLITLTQTRSIYRGKGRLLHPAHCNDTGTRAVMVMQTDMESGEYLWELDLETGSMTAANVPWTPQGYVSNPAKVQVGSHTGVYNGDHANTSFSISSEQTNYRVIAADYRKGLLEYVYQKITQSYSTQGTASHSPRETGAQYTWTTITPGDISYQFGDSWGRANASANSSATGSQEFILKHSTLGELSRHVHGRSESESSSGSASYSLSEEYYPDGGGTNSYDLSGGASWSTNVSISFAGDTPGRVVAAGLSGDLRARSFDIYLTYGNESERMKGYTLGRTINIVRPSRGAIDSDLFETFSGRHNGNPLRTYVDRIRFLNGVKNGRSLATYEEEPIEAIESRTIRLGPVHIADTFYNTVMRAYRPSVDLTLSYGVVKHGKSTDTIYSSEDWSRTEAYDKHEVPTPPAANVLNAVIPICATSSFDGSLYYISSIDWPANGAAIDGKNDVVDVGRLLFNAKIYNAKTGKELVDLNADPSLNPCPGAGKTCTTMLFLGPVRDPNGRYNDRPTYLMKPEQD